MEIDWQIAAAAGRGLRAHELTDDLSAGGLSVQQIMDELRKGLVKPAGVTEPQ